MKPKLSIFHLTTKDVSIHVPAFNRQDAFAKFFLKVKRQEISLEKVGGLLSSHEDDDEYPIRTTPACLLLGLITRDHAIDHIQLMLGVSRKETIELLDEALVTDSWILERVKTLEEKEVL